MKQNLPSKKKYTVQDAINAHKGGQLVEWVQAFLLDEGNHGLAKALTENEARMVELMEVPLSLLQRIEGPEQVVDRESTAVWETRVTKIDALIKEGNELPPLIVTDFWKPLEIVDGNHRHEAMMRNGMNSYWTIFFLKNDASKDLIAKHRIVS